MATQPTLGEDEREALTWVLEAVDWPHGMGDTDYHRAQADAVLNWLTARAHQPTPPEVEVEAERLWNASYHPAMADDREWVSVDGLMRLAYLGRAAHGLLIGREVPFVQPTPPERGLTDCRDCGASMDAEVGACRHCGSGNVVRSGSVTPQTPAGGHPVAGSASSGDAQGEAPTVPPAGLRPVDPPPPPYRPVGGSEGGTGVRGAPRVSAQPTPPEQDCGHPNHGRADHDCAPFTPPEQAEANSGYTGPTRAQAEAMALPDECRRAFWCRRAWGTADHAGNAPDIRPNRQMKRRND